MSQPVFSCLCERKTTSGRDKKGTVRNWTKLAPANMIISASLICAELWILCGWEYTATMPSVGRKELQDELKCPCRVPNRRVGRRGWGRRDPLHAHHHLVA